MLESLFRKPLVLTVGERKLRFDSRSDFEFALASRTEVPAYKLAELVRLDREQLLEEAASVRRVERRFLELLARSVQEPGSIGHLLGETDMNLFSQDHEWRAIMRGLARKPRRFDAYKQLALVKYTQYLASRQDVLKGIYTYKPGVVPAVQEPEPAIEPSFRETALFDVEAMGLGGPPLETSASLPAVLPPEDVPSHLARLPRGEPVDLHPSDAESVELMLSRHPFRLRTGAAAALIDGDGTEHTLRPGRNVIGRHPDSDIMVDASYRDVSRTHVILELEDEALRLTDLSSHGTFVPGTLMRSNGAG